MMADTTRMTAAWWWIDRWRKSTAYTDMTAEEQGLYRNLLDEVWLRESHVIPDDQRILAKVSGDPDAWARCGAKVLQWMTRVQDGWTHTTAQQIIQQSQSRADRQARYRERLHNDRHNADRNGDHNATRNEGVTKGVSPSPSPSPSPSQEQRRVIDKDSGKPLFKGSRFVVMPFMQEELERLLGKDLDGFKLSDWYFSLDEKLRKNGAVDTDWPWLKKECRKEARNRGLILPTPKELERRGAEQLPERASWTCLHKPHCLNRNDCAKLTALRAQA